MLKLGILRSPSGHSLSSIMQTSALNHLGIEGEYIAYGVSSEELKDKFVELKDSDIRGLNVTMPHKISIIPLLDELTERAKLVGSVNTVSFKDGKSIGDNTDVTGFWEAIPKENKGKIPDSNIAVLGCGGATCAIVVALLQNNVNTLTVYGRDLKKLKEFENYMIERKKIIKSNSKISVELLENINLKNVSLLVNTTPVGMYPKKNDCLIKKESLESLNNDALVYDIIYSPAETKLLEYAKSYNKEILNGIDMLVLQGAASLNVWLEKDIAPVEIMKNAVLEHLKSL